ncbi:hypothetical protein Y1Q_0021878 [Alligator mississippiensis]|uniref:Uncharacterized protein n=1 Tax=Alligator mississippiensis TaxID=8496 RepID=A0A151M5Z7_ALLMI|nr:hypothetical protein Y1Q_0021878 [Alligator mississippiensis]
MAMRMGSPKGQERNNAQNLRSPKSEEDGVDYVSLNCPWRGRRRPLVESTTDLQDHARYHRAVMGTIEGYFSVTAAANSKGKKEWAVENLTLASFACLMSSPAVRCRPYDQAQDLIPFITSKEIADNKDKNPRQEYGRCIKYVKQSSGYATLLDRFNCPTLREESRESEILTEFREQLEEKGRESSRWKCGGEKWKKGKVINIMFRTITELLRLAVNQAGDIEALAQDVADKNAKLSRLKSQNDGDAEEKSTVGEEKARKNLTDVAGKEGVTHKMGG